MQTELYLAAGNTPASSKYNIVMGRGTAVDGLYNGALSSEAGFDPRYGYGFVLPQKAYKASMQNPAYNPNLPTLFGSCGLGAGSFCQDFATISKQAAFCYDSTVWYQPQVGMIGSFDKSPERLANYASPGRLITFTP